MREDSYRYLASLLYERSGLSLDRGKEYLLETRLKPLSEKLGASDVDRLVHLLRTSADADLASEIVDLMTTNETSFFRDGRPFEVFFDRLLPELADARQGLRRLRIWCAACSTGQEPYSIVIGILERRPELFDWDLEILGTDLSASALSRAREGLYSHFEAQRGLCASQLVRHFVQTKNGWRLKDDLRRRVRFEQANLLEADRAPGLWDFIFCRNVLIYFDLPLKQKVLENLASRLREDGYLFLGGSETTLGITEAFERYSEADTSVYRKRTGAAKEGRA